VGPQMVVGALMDPDDRPARPASLRRTRSPWLVFALAAVLLVVTVGLTLLNHRMDEDPPALTVIYVAIVAAYATVGAFLASRRAGNPIGWLVLGAGVALVVSGFGDEFVFYGERTNPGSLPFTWVAALLSNLAWGPLLVVLILVVLYFPTGRVPGSGWRFLPPAIYSLFTMAVGGMLLAPGRIDTGPGISIENPIGADGLEGLTDAAQAIGFIGLLPAFGASVISLVQRYRRSQGEERQQIRWLMSLAVGVGVLIVASVAENLFLRGLTTSSKLGDALFLALIVFVGLGVPITLAVAILKYRLYDLDLVVKKTVLYATVAVLLTAVFVSVAFVIGRVAGRSGTGEVVAAAMIGLAFWPAVRLARRVADRVVFGRRASPYEVLADFSGRLAGSYRTEDVLPRMAEILADGVGARSAVVWLRVGNELLPAAATPSVRERPHPVAVVDDILPELRADAAVDVRDGGELLGALAVSMPANDPLNPSKERLVRDLASQARLVLRNVRLIEELRASRQRLVTAQDQERRRLERNIHDGAQQQLVALGVKLGLLEGVVPRDPEKAAEMASQLRAEATEALEDLRDLSRGIYPPLLADEGLAAALQSHARKSVVPTSVFAEVMGRYPAEVESAIYFCCLEALQNVAKYSHASHADVRLRATPEGPTFEVIDDGDGFEPGSTGRGSGLQGMADRLDALGGTLEVISKRGSGTTIRGRVFVRVAEQS
jgi:signal transduction histidine kinase